MNLKNILFFSIISAIFCFSQTAAAQFIFYKNSNYEQPLLQISDDEKVASLPSGINDQISSIMAWQFGQGSACVLVFEHANFKGQWIATQVNPDLGQYQPYLPNLNDAISSVISTPNCIYTRLYQHTIEHQFLTGGTGDIYPLTINHLIPRLGTVGFNDRISSVEVPNGYRLKAWKNSPSDTVLNNPSLYNDWLNTPDYIFHSGYHDVPSNLNDQISAVILQPLL
jgi:hypothetical protein